MTQKRQYAGRETVRRLEARHDALARRVSGLTLAGLDAKLSRLAGRYEYLSTRVAALEAQLRGEKIEIEFEGSAPDLPIDRE